MGQALLPRPPERIGLAINSVAGRSQNLLHIHISCVDPVRRPHPRRRADRSRLGGANPSSPSRATPTTSARWPRSSRSPFLLLTELPGAADDMGAQSLAVIGAADGGFYLVTDSTEPGVVAEAEALLDEDCR